MMTITNPVRFSYVDLVKGIAMLLVVMHHCGTPYNQGMDVMTMLDVPLFFLCSGFLAYKPDINYSHEFRKKTIGILFPFILGVLAFSVIKDVNLWSILNSITKHGYWFLYVLYVMFLLYWVTSALRNTYMRFIIVMVFEIFFIASAKFAPDLINNIFCFSAFARFFPCFIVGALIRKYNWLSLNNKWLGLLLMSLSIVGMTGAITNTNLNFLLLIPAYASSALLLFLFIKNFESDIPVWIGKFLKIIGRYSLNIYIIHFYLIFKAPECLPNNFVCIFTYALIISAIISLLSILIGKILTYTTPLRNVLR